MPIPAVVLAALIAGGLSAAGGVAGTGLNWSMNKSLQEDAQDFNAAEAIKNRQFNALEAQKSRDWTTGENLLDRNFNAAEAQKSRDFQEYMAATNYQRTIADMEKAGINPAALGSSFTGTGSGSAGASASHSSAGTAAAVGSAGTSGINSVNSAFGAELVSNAFLRALGNDKSFAQDFTRNLQHTAKQESINNDVLNDFVDLLDPL